MRKLASIRRILEINPIPDADAIEVATVDGWRVVVKRGEFRVGDLAVYLEVDSWVPAALAPFLIKGDKPREFNGVPGERLRTVRLRRQISQGLLLPLNDVLGAVFLKVPGGDSVLVEEGQDVTEILGVQKWELPMPAQLAGMAKGSFPSYIPKTDQERVQNITRELAEAVAAGMIVEVTEKLEGSSMTVFLNTEGEFGVCSRNIHLKEDPANTFWSVALSLGIEARLRELGRPIAVQGEVIGPGIQGNIYRLSAPAFRVFDIYDIGAGAYLRPEERRQVAAELGLEHAPVIDPAFRLTGTAADLLGMADGRSVLADTRREGLVFKQVDGDTTFKAVSDQYLVNEK